VQPPSAAYPMLVTDLGIVTEVRLEHPSKAEYSILFTELGMVMEVRPEQPENAPPEIPVVPSFISIFVFEGIVPLYL